MLEEVNSLERTDVVEGMQLRCAQRHLALLRRRNADKMLVEMEESMLISMKEAVATSGAPASPWSFLLIFEHFDHHSRGRRGRSTVILWSNKSACGTEVATVKRWLRWIVSRPCRRRLRLSSVPVDLGRSYYCKLKKNVMINMLARAKEGDDRPGGRHDNPTASQEGSSRGRERPRSRPTRLRRLCLITTRRSCRSEAAPRSPAAWQRLALVARLITRLSKCKTESRGRRDARNPRRRSRKASRRPAASLRSRLRLQALKRLNNRMRTRTRCMMF